ncbi:MAG: ABC transporter substrate-binding protein [Dehalococcoidia bacterium]|nr:ABC transporter substrate-binding protein [Dehalococcoidia bacterium]
MAATVLLAVACGGAEPTPVLPTPTTAPAAAPTTAPVATKAATATSAPSATPKPVGPVGNFVLGDNIIDPPVFLPSKMGSGNTQLLIFWGFFEPMMWAADSTPPKLNTDQATFNKGIVQSWTIAPDFSKVTMQTRKGVQFHAGNGEMDAFDVCFSMNDAIKQGSTNSRAAGVQNFVTGFDCPDGSTVIMNIKSNKIDPTWYQILSNVTLGSPIIVSKKLYDKVGEAAFLTSPVGTGVMEPTEWVAGDHISAKPFAQHYRAVPTIASYKIVLMPEAQTRIAALKTGQITAGKVPLALIKTTKDAIAGAKSVAVGPQINQVVMFGGNYWAKTDPTNNNADIYKKRPGFKPDADHPWIGDPDDAAQMEKARMVRQALNEAIDREAIISNIQSGLGKALYTVNNSFPGDPHWSDAFMVKYDVSDAKSLLNKAGYPNCFKFTYYVANGKEWDANVGQAVAQFWRQLGCDVTVDQSDYAAVRPLLVTRQRDNPWMIQVGTNLLPDQNPAGNWRPNAGFNLAVETPIEISNLGQANLDLAGTTYEQRVANSKAFQAYVSQWALAASVSTLPGAILLRPEISAYSPYMNAGPEFVAPETLVMSK